MRDEKGEGEKADGTEGVRGPRNEGVGDIRRVRNWSGMRKDREWRRR